jgi:hypothetical protein
MKIKGIEIKKGDLVEYSHNDAGGGKCIKEVIIDERNSRAFVEKPYNCSKYYNLADLDFILIN